MEWFPKIWHRYVDDIFAIIKKNHLDNIKNNLNNRFSTIKFTFEVEQEKSLTFLDIQIYRNSSQNFEFKIYRKPTSTERFITSDSFHSFSHKLASFNSMVHRMLNIPLFREELKKETQKIYQIAKINGYGRKIIDNIIRKHTKAKLLKETTTLEPINKKLHTKFKVTHFPFWTNKFKRIFRKVRRQIIPSSANKIKNFLCNNKDPIPKHEKSGIYQIKCKTCSKSYIGQSRRKVKIRWKEHLRHIRYNESEKSAVALHFLENLDHELSEENFSLLKEVQFPYDLDAWESLYMTKFKDTSMNTKMAPIENVLFQIAK